MLLNVMTAVFVNVPSIVATLELAVKNGGGRGRRVSKPLPGHASCKDLNFFHVKWGIK